MRILRAYGLEVYQRIPEQEPERRERRGAGEMQEERAAGPDAGGGNTSRAAGGLVFERAETGEFPAGVERAAKLPVRDV